MKLEGVGDSGDDGGVEAEEEATECSGERAFGEEGEGFAFGVHEEL